MARRRLGWVARRRLGWGEAGLGVGTEVRVDVSEEVRVRVLALEIEGVRAPGEQDGELGGQEGVGG